MIQSSEVEVDISCSCVEEGDPAKSKGCKKCEDSGVYTVTIDLADPEQIPVPSDICAMLWRRNVINATDIGKFSVDNLFDMIRRIERDSPEE